MLEIQIEKIYDYNDGVGSKSFLKSLAFSLGTKVESLDKILAFGSLPEDDKGLTLFSNSGFKELLPMFASIYGKDLENVTETKCRNKYYNRISQATLQTFVEQNPKGTYLLILVPYTVVLKDGVLYGDYEFKDKGRARIARGFEVKEVIKIQKERWKDIQE
jgi:hypothetical protein